MAGTPGVGSVWPGSEGRKEGWGMDVPTAADSFFAIPAAV
jgi:hypothetical protein